jgi:hypothetical protein
VNLNPRAVNQKFLLLVASGCFILAPVIGCANAEDCPDRAERMRSAIIKGGQQSEYEACVKRVKTASNETALEHGITPESTCADLSLMMIGVAAPKPVVVLGMSFGKRFTVPKCQKLKDSTVDRFSRTCWTDEVGGTPHSELKRLWYNGDPVIGTLSYASVHDDTLEALVFETPGVKTQDWVMDKLTEKFGEPESCERYPARKASGEQLLIYKAEWYSADVHIKFDAANHDTSDPEKLALNKGRVSMETRAQEERDLDETKKFRAEHPRGKL